MDELARLEHQGRQERQERKRARRELRNAPEMRDKCLRGRRAKKKGGNEERGGEDVLYRFGFVKREDSSPDFERKIRDGKCLRIGENKFRETGFKTLYTWLGNCDFLRLRTKQAASLYVLPERVMLKLLEEAGYAEFDDQSDGYTEWARRQYRRPKLGRQLKCRLGRGVEWPDEAWRGGIR